MLGVIIYGRSVHVCIYPIKFYGRKMGKRGSNCRVVFCFKPLKGNVPLAFYSLFCFVVFFFLVATIASGKVIFLRTTTQPKE